MRKLASVRRISDIKPIEGADRICAYQVDGWWVVDAIEKYAIGDLVVYFEVDSWIPDEIAPFLSRGKSPKVFNGVKGQKLRTMRMKGQISQGLLMPVSVLKNRHYTEGLDVTEVLGIQKWEMPLNLGVQGNPRGKFPSFIKKTDQERVQNLVKHIGVYKNKGLKFEVTEKLDGSSCTIFYRNGEIGVCSRNLELKESDDNVFWRVARDQGLIDILEKEGRNIALQGEIISPKIQGNIYKKEKAEFYLYDIFNIDNYSYFDANERCIFSSTHNILHVPIIEFEEELPSDNIDQILSFADGNSVLKADVKREGVVFKCTSNSFISFKAISNAFLLKRK